jgi:capsule biosynthesis phosphatase
MIVILLCGGAGTRFDNIYPKPLNLVFGIPMINYVLETLKINSLKIIFHTDLENFGFKQYLINNFKNISFEFLPINFQTRGPAETVYLGLKNFECDKHEQILILDNDNIYNDLEIEKLPKENFILYSKNPTGFQHYSFVEINKEGLIKNICERKAISDYICVGGYGFKNLDTCLQYCKETILETTTEPYMSYVFSNLIKNGNLVNSYYLPNCYSIGTPNDILLNSYKLTKKQLRVVFDLDNTLVTYPNIYKDYNTVSPIKNIVNFLNYLKEQGHYIIINTARNMVTSNHIVGKSIKNIGLTTLQNLKDLNITYDEIHFGKPYADLYIDDKGFNTYDLTLFQQMGFYDITNELLNYKTNRYNKIIRSNKNQVIKSGNNISNEIYFYKMISSHPISKFFPKLIQYNDKCNMTMEFINGTNLNKIYSEGLLQPKLFQKLCDNIKELHSYEINDNNIITDQDIINHYFEKFEERSKIKEDYPFEDFEEVYIKIKDNLKEFLSKKYPINNIIHGDLWFSNIMYFKGEFIFFDMRGLFNNKNTIQGHHIYDWAKIYQSISGLDHIIEYDEMIPNYIKDEIEQIFWDNYPLSNKEELKRISGYLIYNTFHAYPKDFEFSKKEKIWNLIKSLI